LEGKPAEALIFYGVSKNQFLFYWGRGGGVRRKMFCEWNFQGEILKLVLK
jgi:hypothetical protein